MPLDLDKQAFANMLRATRGEVRDRSQSQLAQELGLTQGQISKLESGTMHNMSADVYLALMRRFGPDLGGTARGLPPPEPTKGKGVAYLVELVGLVGKDRFDLIDVLGRVAKLWRRGGDVRRQVMEAVDLLES